MRTTLNNLNNIVFYAVDDTVCLVNSTAPIRRKVAAQSFRLADAFVSIAVDVPEQLKNSPESLSILSHPVLEIPHAASVHALIIQIHLMDSAASGLHLRDGSSKSSQVLF